MNAMEKARAKMIFKHVFWATLALSLPLVEAHDIQTAGTDMKRIYYNPSFIEAQTPSVQLFVLAHEVGHVMLLHAFRQKHREHKLWNIACDHELNLILQDHGFDVWKHSCCDRRFKGKSAEQIYDILQREQEAAAKAGKPDPTAGDVGGTGEDLMQPDVQDAADAAQTEDKIKGILSQAATMARQAGQMSKDLQRVLDGLLNPQVPWQAVLRQFMTRPTRCNEDWSRRNRRFDKFYLPGMRSLGMGDIVVIGDTSGSVSDRDMAMIAAEVSSIAEDVSPSGIRCIWWDTQLKGEQLFGPGEPIVIEPVGGGGTRMDLALDYADEHHSDAEVVVMITDGETKWPVNEPRLPLIVVSTGMPSPYGVNILIDPTRR
jgi:predicted metal-dependent peptidase